MKITYLHQYFATRKSITSTRSYEIAKYLVSQGHDVTVITTDAFIKDELNEIPYSRKVSYKTTEGIKVIAQRNKYSNRMSFRRRILSFVKYILFAYHEAKSIKPDLVFSTSTPLTIAIPTLMLYKFKKLKYVFEVRDLWPEAPKQMGVINNKLILWIMKKLEKAVYENAEHIISLSPGMTEGIESTGIPASKITLVPNFSDLELFSLKNIDEKFVEDIRHKYQLDNQFVLAHIGAMGKANGLDYLVKAALILQENKIDDVVIMIAGDGMVKMELEKYCNDNNLQNVIFTGFIAREKIPSLTSIADITMTSFKNLPVLATNSPNKFFDSLAAGKPIIVNSAGWTKDIVEKNQIGYYVDPTKPKKLADLLQELQFEKDYLSKLSPKIKQLAKKEYAVEKEVQKVENVLVESYLGSDNNGN
ncbi:glycosyltransferase WbuB [Companilactobacillus sp. RD055328]|uniref:glycosyltransferase family 4 protein n=1 Tax=Companilactobacillus sp. RD055328 TaxID=2916634 RepID=UPI001FC876A0|nr:glycosyltransferase family 4 protein [Companilactobacillus sp. RD055328]GKQ43366.1 glycosyltransferase WbuB [Companilactobacillus sp. RD055328]